MDIMIPTSDKFVEEVAKAIGRDQLRRDAELLLEAAIGIKLPETDALDARFDLEFEILWNGKDEESLWNREVYTSNAIAAINKINLLLLTMPE
jgi:hypothetical protein